MSEILELTQSDQQVVKDLLSQDAEVDVIVPTEINPELLHYQLVVVAKTIGTMKRATAKLFPLIGRMLMIARDHPDVWQSRGRQSYEEYLNKDIVPATGYSLAMAKAMRRLYESWPSLPLSTYEQLGSEKLKLLSAVGKQSDPSSSAILDKVLSTPMQELKQWAERTRHVPEGSLDMDVLSFAATREVCGHWGKFWKDPRVQSYAGTDSQGGVLEALMQYAFVDWTASSQQEELHELETVPVDDSEI